MFGLSHRSCSPPRAFAAMAFAALTLSGLSAVRADLIPYPNSGQYNSATYSFTAAATGDVIAYFAGSDAADDDKLGMLDNGVLTPSGFGLDDHASPIGASFDLGHATAGDTLVFVLDNLTLGADAYSDSALNVAYDRSNDTFGHNHIYSTQYTATSPIFNGVPQGTYVAFEDQSFPNSDFSYADENFVFSNILVNVPEPAGLLILVLAGGSLLLRRRRA